MSAAGSKVKGGKRGKRTATSTTTSAQPAPLGDMKIPLSNGIMMRAVGICTFRIRKQGDVMEVVNYALAAGYRSFETGPVFQNETYMKEAFRVLLPLYGLNRADIFVTTRFKAECSCGAVTMKHGSCCDIASSAFTALDVVDKKFTKSLENLGLDHVDLYLVHFPACVLNNASDPRSQKIRQTTWAALEEIYDSGRANAIGVYNFTIKHLEDMAENHSLMPAVNQVRRLASILPSQPELVNYCKAKDIVVQASCSCVGGTTTSHAELEQHPLVMKIAEKLKVTCAEVLLVWALQQEVAIVPKLTCPERIKETIRLNFRISDKDIGLLNAFGH